MQILDNTPQTDRAGHAWGMSSAADKATRADVRAGASESASACTRITSCSPAHTAAFALALALVLTFAFSVALITSTNVAYGEPNTTVTSGSEENATESTEPGETDSADNANLYGNEKIEVDVLAEELGRAKTASLTVSIKAAAEKFHADAIAARIPEQQERSDQAARNLYKMQRSRYDIVEMLLSSQSIDEFIRQVDYLHDISQANTLEINRTNDLKKESEELQAKYEKSRDVALGQVTTIKEQLEAAQAVRIARAENGIAESIRQAETADPSGDSGDDYADDNDNDSDDEDSSKSSKKKSKTTPQIKATTETAALNDGADWSQTKEEFVAEWAPRIDAYLEGSPLYGQGENFAKSAWKYCIDPRWSAAISFTESSKGAHCIRPHNAWGWGAADSDPYNLAAEWKSWAEAIDAHARGLAQSYGYTITMSGAQTYCPYTWQSWYNRTLSQMAVI